MKRAFTLIELLVVIAIIAILAAILFPVFAQAKLAAKKTKGMAQAKQIGTASQIYLNDTDDTWFPYRNNNVDNPDYLKTISSRGQAYADSVFGTSARRTIFFKQMLDPYIKSDDLWRSPGQTAAWSGFDPVGNTNNKAQFQSYGGQNSYGVNNYMFTPSGTPPSATSIEDVSNTLMMVDASYYNVLPRNVCQLKSSAFNPTTGTSYPNYWKNLGNSYGFAPSLADPSALDNAKALKDIDARWSGKLNVVRADTSAKSLDSKKVVNDTPTTTYTQSMWDPFKAGCL